MLENLEPAKKVNLNHKYKPGIEFDGSQGTATTPGYKNEPDNFDEFLESVGLDPKTVEIIPPIRTSKWQQREDGEWLTSYRFQFRQKARNVDLPLLMREAEKKPKPKVTKQTDKALVILWSDLQVGKVDYRGNSEALIERVGLMQARLIDQVKREKPKKIIFADLGDTIENFGNANETQQIYSNDLSIMEQVDLATTFAYQTLRQLYEYCQDITYASVGSNHCQFRINKQQVGKGTDDWGVFIGRQLARLTEAAGMTIRFLEPQPHDESLALDVFGDEFHILGLVHGHQARRPDMVATWWRGQAFGKQPVADATLLVHGHWHHLRVTEMGSTPRGTSRFLVMASTMDNGSGWWKKVTGEDSVPGLVTLVLEQGVDFTGTVYKH